MISGDERVSTKIFPRTRPQGSPITQSRKDNRYIATFAARCKENRYLFSARPVCAGAAPPAQSRANTRTATLNGSDLRPATAAGSTRHWRARARSSPCRNNTTSTRSPRAVAAEGGEIGAPEHRSLTQAEVREVKSASLAILPDLGIAVVAQYPAFPVQP